MEATVAPPSAVGCNERSELHCLCGGRKVEVQCAALRLLHPTEPVSGVVALYSPANSRHNGRDTDHDLIEASHRPLKQIHMKILPDKFRSQAEWRRNGQAGYEFHKQSGLVIGGRLY